MSEIGDKRILQGQEGAAASLAAWELLEVLGYRVTADAPPTVEDAQTRDGEPAAVVSIWFEAAR